MKKILLLSSLILFGLVFNVQTKGQTTTTSSISWTNSSGTQNRSMTIYVPNNYNSNNAYKLIIGFHGLGDTHSNYIGALIPYCTDPYYGNVIAVSLQYSDWDKQLYDDGIIPTTINHLKGLYNVDTTNVYLQGFSVGGISSTYRGLKNSDLIHGIITNSGAMAGIADISNNCISGSCKNYDYSKTNEVLICFTSSPTYETQYCSGAANPCNSANSFYAVNTAMANIFNSYTDSSAVFIDNTNNCHCLPTVAVNHQCWDHISQPIQAPTIPIAYFEANTTNIYKGKSISFSDHSSIGGAPISIWQWTFNGGTPSSWTGQNPPAITYANIGKYPVNLTITNSFGSDTETRNNYITVTKEPIGQWVEQASGFSTPGRATESFSIVDQNIAWALAKDGSGNNANVQEFTKTTNAGSTWTPGSINIGNSNLGIAMISAVSATKAYVAAYKISTGTQGVYVTTDGGSTWNRQTTASFQSSTSFTNVVHFWNQNDGFCMGDPVNGEFELYTTTDGGNIWNAVSGSDIPNPLAGEYGYTGQYAVNGDHIWFSTNKGRLYHSTDKGYTWSVAQTPISDFGGTNSSGIYDFKDSNNGLLIANSGVVYRTTDGGANWSTISTSGNVYKQSLSWINGTNILFSSGINPAGSSLSLDGGYTWNTIDTEVHFGVKFLSASVGYSGYVNTNATTKGVWKWQLNGPIGLEDFNTDHKNKINIYPNPTDDLITISNVDGAEIHIFDVNGRLVLTKVSTSPKLTLSLSSLSKGAYIVKILKNNSISVKKLILK